MSGKVAVVVVIITTVYIIIGGVVFKILEETHDEERRQQIRSTLDAFFNSRNCLNNQDIKEILSTIEDAVQYGVGVLGSNRTSSATNWDFYSSVFFAVTVVTTIGYGNAPLKTDNGRAFCIVYGIAGVPLCLFTLFVVGQQEKRLIYHMAKRLAFGFREDKRKLHWFSTFMVSFAGSIVFLYLSAVVFMVVEGWTYREAVYFCVISLLTIGFGDRVAGWSKEKDNLEWYRVLIAMWILFGLSWCTIVVSVCQDIYMDLFEKTRKVAGAFGTQIESSVKSKIDSISTEMAAFAKISENNLSNRNNIRCPSTSKAKDTTAQTSADESSISEVQNHSKTDKSISLVVEQCAVSTD